MASSRTKSTMNVTFQMMRMHPGTKRRTTHRLIHKAKMITMMRRMILRQPKTANENGLTKTTNSSLAKTQ